MVKLMIYKYIYRKNIIEIRWINKIWDVILNNNKQGWVVFNNSTSIEGLCL